MDVSQAQDKLAALESDLKELEVELCSLIRLLAFVLTLPHQYRRIRIVALQGGSAELISNLREDLKTKISELSALKSTHENLNADKAKKEAEVAELTSQKESLQAQLDEDAATNAQQIEHIKKLTVGTLFSTKTMLRLFYACCAQYLRLLVIVDQDEAAQDTEELDALETQCLELSAELKDKEDKLAQIQEIERKCSREYIAYEKAKSKAQRAKEVKRKDYRKFG